MEISDEAIEILFSTTPCVDTEDPRWIDDMRAILEAFGLNIAAQEREACAKVARNACPDHDQDYNGDRSYERGIESAQEAAAAAIRARGDD